MKRTYRALSQTSILVGTVLLLCGSWTGFFIAVAFCLIFATNEKISK